jgi:NDP-sugar pyrophosphorylase family protein
MIVAAGLGTRLRPLSDLRPKPAMPVRGIPLLAYQLALLARHGVTEVVINAHHLLDELMPAAQRYRPAGVELHFSVEDELLGTGGGIRRVASFLRESDPCLIVGGDMLVDADLTVLMERHRSRGDAWTLLLRDDARGAEFGTIGLDGEGRLRRIGKRFDLGSETQAGLYTWINVVAARAFDSLPDRSCFGHLDDWVAPRLAAGDSNIRGELWSPEQCTWEPVGTLREYLAVNLAPCSLGYIDADAWAQSQGTRFEPDLVIGAGATLEPGARLRRAVVWEGETVPAHLHASGGVFASGAFHPCPGDET